MRYIILIYIVSACSCLVASSQPAAIFFDRLTTKDGLTNNTVGAIIKDQLGFLWIGTADGLSRYDGKNFIPFYHSIHEQNSLPHNDVYCLMQDDRGYIWAGTYNGLCKLNPSTNEIKRIRCTTQTDTTAFHTISDVKQNPRDGSVWVATNKGLFWVNQKKDELIPAPDNQSEQFIRKQFLTKIIISHPDTFWIASYEGITRYNPGTGQYISFEIPSYTSQKKTLAKSIYMDKQGKIWIGTWGRGLQRFDPATQTFSRFLPRPDLGERSDANIIYDITQTGLPEEENILWVAADASGLLAFDMQTGKFKSYSTQNENSRHGIFGHGFSFCFARDEGLWIGGSNGLYRYDPHHQLFRHASLNFNPQTFCLKEILHAKADASDTSGKTLFVSTWSCGSYRLNLKDGSAQQLPAWIMKHVGTGYITAFHRDENILWIGTSTEGLLKVNEKNKTVVSFYPPVTNEVKRPHNIQHLLDDGKGNFWLGTQNGLFLMNKIKGTIIPVFRTGLNAPADVSDEVRALTFDNKRNLWFCTNLRNDKKPLVGKIAVGSKKPVLFYNNINDPNSFPERSPLQSITVDKNNTIWCASWNGLVYWNAAETKPLFKRLTRKEGLCNDKVFKVLADDSGNIWTATLRGISCYDPDMNTFRNYYAAQGLYQDNVSNFFKNDVTGEMIAGYEGSLDILDPAKASQKKETPNIVITGLKIFNEPYADNKKSYVNRGWIPLSPGQNMLTISFSALSFTDPQDVRYAYKMDGVDQDWIITTNDFVTYHNLPHGSRKFYVKARNAEGMWSREDAWLEIDIAPPFYKKWWFIALAVVVVSGIAYLLYRERIRRLEEKFRIRSIIARDLHDEIGSTLTSINILSRVSRSNLERDQARAASLLQKITEQSQDMQQSMSDIIWAIKPDNDKLENMAARMREYLSHTLEAKNIAIRFEADEQVLKESLNMEQRRDFFLIFKEAVNNATKYAGSDSMTVMLNKIKHNIVLSVADEGVGFDVTKKYSSNGLKNMLARAAALKAELRITSAPGKGTTVLLSIPTT